MVVKSGHVNYRHLFRLVLFRPTQGFLQYLTLERHQLAKIKISQMFKNAKVTKINNTQKFVVLQYII